MEERYELNNVKLMAEGRIESLDVVRFIATLCVIIGHAKAFGLSGIEHFGTIIFFLISGMLNAKNLHKLKSIGSVVKWYKKKILRIFPLYIITCLLLSVIIYGFDYIRIIFMVKTWSYLWYIRQLFFCIY